MNECAWWEWQGEVGCFGDWCKTQIGVRQSGCQRALIQKGSHYSRMVLKEFIRADDLPFYPSLATWHGREE